MLGQAGAHRDVRLRHARPEGAEAHPRRDIGENRLIVVTVELDSANGEKYDEHLFTMVIGNDGTGSLRRGNYNVYLGRRGKTDPYTVIKKPLRKGRVENHQRLGTHVGALVRKALESVNL
jgi:hypothetical protein